MFHISFTSAGVEPNAALELLGCAGEFVQWRADFACSPFGRFSLAMLSPFPLVCHP